MAEVTDDQPVDVLLVEDDLGHATLVRHAFASHPLPFRLVVAPTIGEAQARLGEALPALVIADLLLPDGEGITLLPPDREPPFPLIVVTAQGDEARAVQALKAGALDYVIKSAASFRSLPHVAERVLREWTLRMDKARAESALRLLDRAVEASTQGISITDPSQPDNPLIYANGGFESITGYDRGEIVGRNMRFLQGPDTDPATVAALGRAIGEGKPFATEILNYRKNAEPFWCELKITPVRDSSGQVTHYIGIHSDVTRRKRAAGELHRQAAHLQTLSRKLVEVQETERRALAHELHDALGQMLTVIRMGLQNALRCPDPAHVGGLLTASVTNVDEAIRQVRSLALDLRPPMLDDLGLVPTLRWYLRERIDQADLAIHLCTDPPALSVPTELATVCFRVVQEALTNVRRHARAARAEVEVRQTVGRLELTVRDDGAGFDVPAAHARAESGQSVGLMSMKERVQLAGGELQIDSALSGGTQIRAVFPLRTVSDP